MTSILTGLKTKTAGTSLGYLQHKETDETARRDFLPNSHFLWLARGNGHTQTHFVKSVFVGHWDQGPQGEQAKGQ